MELFPFMRWILVLMALALSGCLGGDPGFTDADNEPFEPVEHTFPFTMSTPAGPDPGTQQEWTFTVPDPATDVAVVGQISCVSLCPIRVIITDGAGTVVRDSVSGGWSDSYAAVPGEWTLRIEPSGQGGPVGAEGEHRVTVS